MRTFWKLAAAVLLALAVWHVGGNLLARNSPPAACQVFGGHWSLVSGWRC